MKGYRSRKYTVENVFLNKSNKMKNYQDTVSLGKKFDCGMTILVTTTTLPLLMVWYKKVTPNCKRCNLALLSGSQHLGQCLQIVIQLCLLNPEFLHLLFVSLNRGLETNNC
jgi:hypothetical protein